ncbi:unnamed protein product [Trifolium pratense]|uniref:Uncharacterized protein n=1 Tax=Trifolium pratense TaxID=57577 RepID=A0ACB0KNZ6_TRIPR|nr:unnamed protein product [Trifolium pratense]
MHAEHATASGLMRAEPVTASGLMRAEPATASLSDTGLCVAECYVVGPGVAWTGSPGIPVEVVNATTATIAATTEHDSEVLRMHS